MIDCGDKVKKVISLISIFVVIIIGVLLYKHAHAKTKVTTPPPVVVAVSAVHVKTIPLYYTTTATVSADQQTNITAKVAGYITAIYFQEGDQVKQHAKLIALDNSKEQAALAADQATYQLDDQKYLRNLKLLSAHYVAPQDIAALKTTVAADSARISEDQSNLNDKTLIAPFAGTLGKRELSLGDYIAPGTVITTLVDTQHLKVSYNLPTIYMHQAQLGQAIRLNDETQSATSALAHINYISPIIDNSSQTVEIHANYQNTHDRFKPGQIVRVQQPIGKLVNAILVPEQAVIQSIDGDHVFTINNGKAKQVDVTVGQRSNGYIVISSGLKPTSKIITLGQNQVRPGAQVTVKASKS